MPKLTKEKEVRCYSSGTLGRAICNARSHHIIADGPNGDELQAAELFFGGVVACAVNLIERVAQAEEIPLDWVDVNIASYRNQETVGTADPGNVSLHDDVKVHFKLWGITEEQGLYLVDIWKRR